VCVCELRPTVGLQDCCSCCVAISPDRNRVLNFTRRSLAADDVSLDGGRLHVWDVSSDGTPVRHKLVHGCETEIGIEFASAALFRHDATRRVEFCAS
jgi:hypothetical protein